MKRLLLNSLFIIFILILISCSNIRNKATTKINNKNTEFIKGDSVSSKSSNTVSSKKESLNKEMEIKDDLNLFFINNDSSLSNKNTISIEEILENPRKLSNSINKIKVSDENIKKNLFKKLFFFDLIHTKSMVNIIIDTIK